MIFDKRKASFGKRIFAGLLDGILLVLLAVGIALVISSVVKFDSYSETMQASYERFEMEYGVDFDITQEEYLAMSEEEKAQFDRANNALTTDPDAVHAYNMAVNLTLVMAVFGSLLAYLVLEFVVPLMIGNGQTLGKKLSGIAVIGADGSDITVMRLFIRTFLGKFAVETMIPVLIVLMIFWGVLGQIGITILGLILLVQTVLLTRDTGAVVHDLLAKTVTVELVGKRRLPARDRL